MYCKIALPWLGTGVFGSNTPCLCLGVFDTNTPVPRLWRGGFILKTNDIEERTKQNEEDDKLSK